METNNNQQVVAARPAMPMSITQLMGNDAVKNRFNEILGAKAPGFISSVLSVAKQPTLRDADPNTVLASSVVAATLDLPINQSLGFAYIVPYVNKGHKEAQFQLGYKGFIQLAQRSGQYKTINACEIREGELVANNILTGDIKIECVPGRESRKVIGYAAYFELVNGFSKSLYMSVEEMDAHAKKYSQSYRNDKYGTSLWKTQFDTMAKKTVLKQLLSKYGPLTIEMQKAQTYDQSVVRADISNDELNIIEEAEYVDNTPDAVAPATESAETAATKNAAMAAAGESFNEPNNGKLF